MRKALLLDFDGVVLKHCAAHELVTNRCRRFIQNKLNIHYSNSIADGLYKTYGHSVIAINKISNNKATKTEFNNYVYHGVDASWFRDLQSMEHQNHFKTVKQLVEKSLNSNTELYLFSNAPSVWIETAMRSYDPSGYFMSNISIIESGPDLLKPNPQVYEFIEQMLKVDEICFVEDSLINLTPLINNSKWIKVWYNDTNEESNNDDNRNLFKLNDNFLVVKTLSEI